MFGGILTDALKVKDIRNRILFTLLIVALYRLGAHIPLPGVDHAGILRQLEGSTGAFGFLDMFTGGALARFSVFSMGIIPYINASIVMQLLIAIFPYLERLSREEEGREKIKVYTRYLTVFFAALEATGMSIWFKNGGLVKAAGPIYFATVILSLTAGAMLLMWMAEQIDEFGIGNGASILIFTSIVARIPLYFARTIAALKQGEISAVGVSIYFIGLIGIISAIVYVELMERKIRVKYGTRIVGRRVYGGQEVSFPIKVNMASVIPIIFAAAFMTIPTTVSQWMPGDAGAAMQRTFRPDGLIYNIIYFVLVFLLTFFYVSVIFNTEQVADNLRRYGGTLAGFRPGTATAWYLDELTTKTTTIGALFLATIAIIPSILQRVTRVEFALGGTALLIVVGVSVELLREISFQLELRGRESLLKRAKVR